MCTWQVLTISGRTGSPIEVTFITMRQHGAYDENFCGLNNNKYAYKKSKYPWHRSDEKETISELFVNEYLLHAVVDDIVVGLCVRWVGNPKGMAYCIKQIH